MAKAVTVRLNEAGGSLLEFLKVNWANKHPFPILAVPGRIHRPVVLQRPPNLSNALMPLHAAPQLVVGEFDVTTLRQVLCDAGGDVVHYCI